MALYKRSRLRPWKRSRRLRHADMNRLTCLAQKHFPQVLRFHGRTLRLASSSGSGNGSDISELEPGDEIRSYFGIPYSDRQTIGGIANSECSNMCYVNALLQALGSTNFVQWLRDQRDSMANGDRHDRLIGLYDRINQQGSAQTFFSRIAQTPTPIELGLGFTFTETGPSARDFRQNDVHELLVSLITDVLQAEYEKWHFEMPELESGPLHGETVTRIVCLDCGESSQRTELINHMALFKPNKRPATESVSFKTCLDFFTKVELQRGNCRKCTVNKIKQIVERAISKEEKSPTPVLAPHDVPVVDLLKQRLTGVNAIIAKNKYDDYELDALHMPRKTWVFDSSKTQTTSLSKLPKCICMAFYNVNTTDAYGRSVPKLKTRVAFTQTVDLAPYHVDMAGDTNLNEGINRLRTGPKDAPLAPQMYELRSVIFHRGPTVSAGHFVCYRREWRSKKPMGPSGEEGSKTEPQWWYCNEGFTMRVKKDDVFQGGGERSRHPVDDDGHEVMLIYERVAEGEGLDPPDFAGKVDWNIEPGMWDENNYWYSEEELLKMMEKAEKERSGVR